ncbi:zinc finger MYND domain-containing protein 11 isoform X1 [Cotesia glomerata]|uniref:zinc finger MYND domain-containing protein 11 isoform X1 n=1 Tax=Cotesia glomerata TaxID=32391 RepID=UPI001D00AB32|nr:zinc finger MYND domain-containing protein 11 isoform X1 [Cotesia glomerata]XP_044597800.1 zinc finger MYND domain-containing protein 11 isoform X1 [Cotesia glomerata]XP_044597801.1 zinc finger MYND domain-containing protein 11 isoform X1 [Cotesia glomerata]XP_044597802.1 zinc finger MYND domain-containing protein 11 isoform X1 [Cotesia glomerata]XP_044597803.1 zinc finger MYND domain-containing protein 11 isoform X1 [Cotesia glomerata]
MSVRRRTDPAPTQRIWDAIKLTVHQRSLPSNERIVRHFARVYNMTELAAQEELNKAVEDGLVFLKKSQSKGGLDQESYRLPLDPREDDGNDWYCFKCQKAGLVQTCQTCFRVYHPRCHTPNNSDQKICQFCEQISADTYHDVNALNHILGFTCGHLKAKLPPEITNRTIVPDSSVVEKPAGGLCGPTWISEGEDSWRPGILIKNHMDLAIMEAKTKRNEYKSLAEFQTDAHNILHNIIVYHGEASVIGEMGKIMYQDCCYDLKEIRRCADCYRISNEKSEKMWFCIPCNPPHQLVYAKQKGYPYWPAKVMEIKGNIYDVRFFGGHHMRANIEKIFIRSITSSLQSLQHSDKGKWKDIKIKRSTAWNRAFEELKHHQSLLTKLPKSSSSVAHNNNSTNAAGTTDDVEGPKPSKMRRHQESSESSQGSQVASPNGVSPVKLTKDLRVRVERLMSDGNSEIQLNQEKSESANGDGDGVGVGDGDGGPDEKPEVNDGSRSTSEERQVPFLPVAIDEEPPLRISSSTCPEGLKKEGSQEDMVTSSSQEPRSKCVLVQTEEVQPETAPAKYVICFQMKRERRTSEQTTTAPALEKLRREFELDKCRELERLQAEHAKELRQLTEKHQQVISEIKKKQWCYNCEAEAIYHCCWNTAYCSTDCQQVHWQREHKRVCRRKR